ncbi:DUF4097 family beta strand repeat-containing protein [Bhargavaea ginsengi]|uniref:DUF4097 family beta strand repeat-containing protein n=1 Tax=Bhargavaea ginsengi TaxID=426757 RepID=UPI00203D2222|nr:DUF4097 family beta strand repeat-containing protein [Bhargavaea ginsengi]MCM3087778.1 DUF4097 family beta strand repeat-containing protein [Bhargavaea ginsengi]
MKDEKSRILDMLEQGTISADEALRLLEKFESNREAVKESHPEINDGQADKPAADPQQAVGGGEEADNWQGDFSQDAQPEGEEHRSGKQASMDDFLEDVRRDFTTFGNRFMQFMQTAVDRVKTFDIDKPFGDPVVFHETFTKSSEGIEEINVDLSMGSFDIRLGEGEEFRAECEVKVHRAEDEAEAKREFEERFLFITDGNRLRITNDQKMTQVNVVLHVPEKQYKKLAVRMFNGTFSSGTGLTAAQVRVRTANGKIEADNLHFDEAEFETANGAIRLKDIHGEQVEAETLNGRIDIDGMLKDIEAQSVNGHVIVTTRDAESRKVEATAMSGSVEVYVPQEAGIEGEVSSNFGRMDIRMQDVTRTKEQEQLLQKSIRFRKEGGNPDLPPLRIKGEAKTGTVIVGYIGN